MAYRISEPERAVGPATPRSAHPHPRDTYRIERTRQELGTARCPICRYALVARLGRRGPFFFCGCRAKRAA